MTHPFIEEQVKEFLEKRSDWEYSEDCGSELDSENVVEWDSIVTWLHSSLTSTYLKALEDVRREMPEEIIRYPKDVEDKELNAHIVAVNRGWNSCRSATLSAITRLEQNLK